MMDIAQKIADKAHDLFIRYGIRSISMDKIAGSLGISKKTVYQFFSSKDDLVTTFVENEITVNIARCESLKAKNSDAILELFFILTYAKDFYKTLYPALMHDLENNHPDAFKKLHEHRQGYLAELMKANMTCGVRNDLYQDDLNFEVITEFLLESLTIILNPDLPHINNQWELLFGYLIRGLLTAKGLALFNHYKHQQEGPLLNGKYFMRSFWDG
ncbi:TetR family transcriptional regulator [Mucilaginibacter oryzae]|uniref:TetR family transcriptional regulator n=1 Tax=Mucilaginibacter oryzae TaxID=468058 RepID=A0A316HFB5_9SPHI|nr:TetR/AcrR family transcriptional regulator [Mucilaginibacter oryzae]PWK79186.1 TetR family transcriptional regulator [Mucilaginibacter oryzae]